MVSGLDSKQLSTLLITVYEQQQEKLVRLATDYTRLHDQNQDLEYKLQSLQEDYKRLNNQNVDIKHKLASLQAKMKEHESDIVVLQKADHRHDEDPDQIAFSVVSHQDFGPVAVDTNIPFEVIYTNVGGGWSSATNAFHASVAGVYMFTASIVSHASSNETQVRCRIVHSFDGGQTPVASLQGVGSHQAGDANSVILQLEVGEVTSVQLMEGEQVIRSTSSYVRSTFSGFLLFKSGE